MKYKIYILLLFSILGCRKETLEIFPSSAVDTPPPFNFNIEHLTTEDTIAAGQSISYNLYIRQQLAYVPGIKYYVSFVLPQAYDGEALINDQAWRSGDVVAIDYDKVVKNNYRVRFTYKPSGNKPASYSIDFTCSDAAGQSQSFTKQIHIK